MKKYNYIYKITNVLNRKIYIGKHSTDDLEDGYMGSGVLLKKAKEKYGIENFTKEIVAITDNEDDLNELEKLFIGMFNSTDTKIGYNMTFGGDGGIPTDEIRKRIGKIHKGKVLSEETKKKISESRKGKHYIKLSESKKGKLVSEETKLKISETSKGRMFSKETRRKISEANKGKPKPKQQWMTTSGEIVEMTLAKRNRWHPDWKEYNEI